MNHAKLAALRDAHARLHAEYRDLTERARAALGEVTILRNYPASGTLQQVSFAAELLSRPDLSGISDGTLAAAGLDRKLVDKITVAQSRATALRAEAERLAPALRRSGLLIARLNEYAQTA